MFDKLQGAMSREEKPSEIIPCPRLSHVKSYKRRKVCTFRVRTGHKRRSERFRL